MDFFAQQDRSRRKTRLLVFYYILAIVLTILASYALVFFVFQIVQQSNQVEQVTPTYTIALNNATLPPETINLLDFPLLFYTSLVVILVVGGGSLTKTFELSQGGGVRVAELMGGTKILPNTNDPAEKRLLNIVEEIAIASGVRIPSVYVMYADSGINAFAAGFTENEAVVAVTRGTMELLSRDELQGVIAHEFSHILNGDMRLNIRLIGILFGLQLVAWIGWMLIRFGFLSGGNRRSNNGKSSGGATIALLILGIGLCIIGAIGIFFCSLIKAAISRQREFLADASAVQFTRSPQGIAGALKKIGAKHIGSQISSAHAMEASHMFMATPGMFELTSLFATHPPLAERIKRIDPTWDGKFPQNPTRTADYHEQQKSLEQRRQQSPQPAAGGNPPARDFLSNAVRLTAASVLGSIGQLQLNKLFVAQGLICDMPDLLKEKAHNVDSAPVVVYALLINPESEVQWKQLEYLGQQHGPDLVGEVRQIMETIKTIPIQARFPLAEVTLPTLKQLTLDQYKFFRDTVVFLVRADDAIDLFEYTLQIRLLRELDVHFRLRKPLVVQYHSVTSVMKHHIMVLSYLAYLGHDTPDQAAEAFQIGLAALNTKGNILPRNECTAATFDASLQELGQASPAVKQKIIPSFVACIAADGKVTVKEGELLRAITAMLDCPMPPLS